MKEKYKTNIVQNESGDVIVTLKTKSQKKNSPILVNIGGNITKVEDISMTLSPGQNWIGISSRLWYEKIPLIGNYLYNRRCPLTTYYAYIKDDQITYGATLKGTRR